MHALVRLPLLEADAAEAAHWYDRQKPGLGEEFRDAFKAHLRGLAEQLLRDTPLSGDNR